MPLGVAARDGGGPRRRVRPCIHPDRGSARLIPKDHPRLRFLQLIVEEGGLWNKIVGESLKIWMPKRGCVLTSLCCRVPWLLTQNCSWQSHLGPSSL